MVGFKPSCDHFGGAAVDREITGFRSRAEGPEVLESAALVDAARQAIYASAGRVSPFESSVAELSVQQSALLAHFL